MPIDTNEIKEITSEQVKAYIQSISDKSESTIRRIIRVLNRLLSFYPSHTERAKIELSVKTERILKESDFAKEREIKKLIKSMQSTQGLNDHQAIARFYIGDRNLSIVLLMIDYGLSLGEIERISMNDINFTYNTIRVSSAHGHERTIQIENELKKMMYKYYLSIPEGVRPYLKSSHAFFVAFLPTNNSFMWEYSNDRPKRLTGRSIRYMLHHEAELAGVTLSARTIRNRFILNKLLEGRDLERLTQQLGYTNTRTLRPYVEYVKVYEQQKSTN
jgi:site-specific recombinase XerD